LYLAGELRVKGMGGCAFGELLVLVLTAPSRELLHKL
jgi:hypothetical protein